MNKVSDLKSKAKNSRAERQVPLQGQEPTVKIKVWNVGNAFRTSFTFKLCSQQL